MKNSRNIWTRMFQSIWTPIYNLQEMIPMLILSTLCAAMLTFVYNFLKAVKTSFILGEPGAGAAAIPFLKVWGILPASLFAAWMLSILNKHIGVNKLFFLIAGIYILFFAWFSRAITHIESYYLTSVVDVIENILPHQVFVWIKPGIILIKIWPLTLFYCFAEIWVLAIFFFCFFGYINAISDIHKGTVLYTGINLIGNATGIFVAPVLKACNHHYNTEEERYVAYMYITIIAIAFACFFFLNILIFSAGKTKTEKELVEKAERRHGKMTKSLLNSFRMLKSSNYAFYLTLSMILYQTVVNLVETIWNIYLVSYANGDKQVIVQVVGQIISATAILSSSLSILLPWIMSRNCFYFSSIGFPVTVFAMLSFLVCLLVTKSIILFMPVHLSLFDSYDLFMVQIGSILVVLLRSCKYSIYDTMKELCLIAMPKERLELKVVIDTFGSRFGKVIGSVMTLLATSTSIALLHGSVDATVLMLGTLSQSMSIFWIHATKIVANSYLNLTAPKKNK